MNKIIKYAIYWAFAVCYFCTYSQNEKKETLYILFDEEVNGNRYMMNDKGKLIFYIQPTIDASYFSYEKSKQCKKLIEYEKVKSDLISKKTANQKVIDYLKDKSLEFKKKTGVKGLPPIPPFYYNSYFKKIYIYRKIDETCGMLYEVSWIYAIE